MDNIAKTIFAKISSTFDYTQEHSNTGQEIVNCSAVTMSKNFIINDVIPLLDIFLLGVILETKKNNGLVINTKKKYGNYLKYL